MSDPLTFPLLSTKCCKVLLGQNKMRTLFFWGFFFLCHHGDEQSLSLSGIKPFPLRAGVETALLNQQRLINWFTQCNRPPVPLSCPSLDTNCPGVFRETLKCSREEQKQPVSAQSRWGVFVYRSQCWRRRWALIRRYAPSSPSTRSQTLLYVGIFVLQYTQ